MQPNNVQLYPDELDVYLASAFGTDGVQSVSNKNGQQFSESTSSQNQFPTSTPPTFVSVGPTTNAAVATQVQYDYSTAPSTGYRPVPQADYPTNYYRADYRHDYPTGYQTNYGTNYQADNHYRTNCATDRRLLFHDANVTNTASQLQYTNSTTMLPDAANRDSIEYDEKNSRLYYLEFLNTDRRNRYFQKIQDNTLKRVLNQKTQQLDMLQSFVSDKDECSPTSSDQMNRNKLKKIAYLNQMQSTARILVDLYQKYSTNDSESHAFKKYAFKFMLACETYKDY